MPSKYVGGDAQAYGCVAKTAGMVEMNGKFGGAGSPFGGMKHSGNGREGGTWGLEEFLEVKAVSDWE